MPEDALSFKRGDFVRSKKGLSRKVGVVGRINSNSAASVVVHWRESATGGIQLSYEPKDLELVPSEEIPEDAIELKKILGI
jgi:hypothetical protein